MSVRMMAALGAALALCACDAPPPDVTFDGARALEYVKLQVEAGPRIPGTEPHRLVGDRIVAEMRKNADTVIEQTWVHVTQKGDSLPLRNIFAQFNRAAAKRILYVAHWDTKPFATKSFSKDDQTKPVLGANDGASGVALLLVLAEALKAVPPTVGVDFLFTDGEDYGEFNPDVDVLLGAKYYADHVLPDPSYRPEFGVLWDMIGDKDLNISREARSEQAARDLNDRIWKMAKALGYSRAFINNIMDVNDDHVPLIAKGFRIVDIIDLDYGPGNSYHHSTQDTVDKVSAESLTIVGRVALALIRAEEKK